MNQRTESFDTQADPGEARMVFLRVGWMDRYQGLTSGDKISGGGAYVAEHGFGAEIFNYQPFQGTVYGYAQPHSRKGKWEEATIRLGRLGAAPDAKALGSVLVVWVATSPSGGAFVVGWFRNATVYGTWQKAPSGSGRRHNGLDCGYFVTASSKDAVLVPPDERVFSIPQRGKGNFGQSNVWYADDAEQHRELRRNILRYTASRQLPDALTAGDSRRIQPDQFLRQRIERIAVETTAAYFANLGYRVQSVERDNVGWDMNAVLGGRDLRLEVKGLSGPQLVVDLTPKEHSAMTEYRSSYRLCVVTTALAEPTLSVFAYSAESDRWESSNGRVLNVREIIAARCSVA
jgi:hypothetical protein